MIHIHTSSIIIVHPLHSLDFLLHWSSVIFCSGPRPHGVWDGPGAWWHKGHGCKAAKFQMYCILLYLTVQILKDSPDLRCFGSNLARLQCCRSDFESFGDEWARAIENLVGIYYSTSPFHQPVNCELGIKVLESKKQWHSDTTTSL